MTLHLETETEETLDLDCGRIAQMVASRVLDMEKFPYEAEVNLLITDNEEIRRINAEFRDIAAPTDVLSFPMVDFPTPADYSVIYEDPNSFLDLDSGEVVLGDIVISAEKVISQAQEYGHSQEREFAFLVAHSMLHLLGYDHMEPGEAAVMEDKQRRALEELGIHR